MRGQKVLFCTAVMALLAGLWGCGENEGDLNRSINDEEGIVSYSTRNEPGNYTFYSNYALSSEGTRVYVADSESVTAFSGIPYNESLIPLLTEDSLIGMAEAADILEDGLASRINAVIDSVELTYLPLSFQPEENTFEIVIFPCWKFFGTNRIKDEQVKLYVDVLTGDIYRLSEKAS